MGFDLYKIIISIIPIILAITIHEFAHGWVAKRYGDSTAFSQGRVTLNPLNHIDPIGTVLIPIITYVTTGFIFGWAKPVPVRFDKLRNMRNDGIKVAMAGPASNLIMAIIWAAILPIGIYASQFSSLPFFSNMADMAHIGISVNVIFFVFNLIPLPPLDGGRVLQFSLPPTQAVKLDFLEQYGMFIIMALAFAGVLSKIIHPFTSQVEGLLSIVSMAVMFILHLI